MSKHQYYYKPSGGKPGRKPSEHTLRQVGDQVEVWTNAAVVIYIRQQFEDPLVDYGYHRMSGQLSLGGFYINHKKVYRLMKGARLLQVKRKVESKDYVKYRVVCPEAPLRLMEMDIKMIWVEGLRRYAYVLTILDVFTRVVLHWRIGFEMKQGQVQQAWGKVIEDHLQPAGALAWETHIEVRSDNGPQFCAKKLRQFFKDNYLAQVFTHPYTPQENGHVESFHAILGRALQGQYFENIGQLQGWLEVFYDFYNHRRVHGSTLKLPPMTFYQLWELGHIDRRVLDQKRKKVRFALKVPRQQIRQLLSSSGAGTEQAQPADNGSQREVSSLDLVGVDPPVNPNKSQTDGPVLIAQPAAQRSPSVVSSQCKDTFKSNQFL